MEQDMNYLIIEISNQIKRPEVKKDSKYRMSEASIPRKSGSYTKAPIGASFAKDSKPSNAGNTRDIKDVECFKCHKKGHYANKCPIRCKGKRWEGILPGQAARSSISG